MADYIRYRNQGATRNQPLSDDLVKRLAYLQDMGITAEVFSGGQDAEGPNRTGSHRHDHGGAGDVFFYKDGKKLDWSSPEDLPVFNQIVSQGKANGITGFGAGDGYMQPGSMHIGGGNAGVWGAGGKGANAAPWLKAAYEGTPLSADTMVASAVSAKPPEIAPLGATAQAQSTIANPNAGKVYRDGAISYFQNKNEATAPKQPDQVAVGDDGKAADRGLLEKMGVGKMPDSILGMDTNKGLKAFGTIAVLSNANTQAQNQQMQGIASNARARRESAPDIQIAAAPSSVLQSGGLGGGQKNQMDEMKKRLLLAQLLGGAGGGLLG